MFNSKHLPDVDPLRWQR